MRKVFRVLIVDDDREWAGFCRDRLRKLSDVIVEVSGSIDEAISKIEELLYDVVYCDFRMPYQDKKGIVSYEGGNIISAKAKSCLPQVKTVMITAYGSADLARESLVKNKFDDYIEKQVDPDDDVIAMKRFLTDLIENWDKRAISANPFQAQRGLVPRYIVPRYIRGRSDFESLVDQLESAERWNQARFMILGRVGSGKSCLLNHFRNYVQRKGNLASIYELSPTLLNGDSDLRDEASELLSGIVRGFRMKAPEFPNFLKRIETLGGSVEALGFKVELDWKRKDLPVDTVLRDGLEGLLADLERKTETVTILLDNMSVDCALPQAVRRLVHVISEPIFTNRSIVVGVSILERDAAEGSATTRLDPELSRFFAGKLLRLSNFRRDQCHELCVQTLAGTGVTFEGALINRAYEFSQGNPFICQLLFSYLYGDQIGERVEEGSFEIALRNCLVELTSFFQDFFSGLTEDDQTILQVIVNNGGRLVMEELQSALLKKKAGDLVLRVPELCASMINRKILRDLGGNTFSISFS